MPDMPLRPTAVPRSLAVSVADANGPRYPVRCADREREAYVSEGGILRGRPWLRAWLVVGLAAWTTFGVLLVARANNFGLVDDISISPYHIVGYAALLALGGLRRVGVFPGAPPRRLAHARSRRSTAASGSPSCSSSRGSSSTRSGGPPSGSASGSRTGSAPSRLLIPPALVLLAIGPVREAIAARAEPGCGRGAPASVGRAWSGRRSSALPLTFTAFNPVRPP